jgi:ELWxxDGT repeat protein
LIKTAAAGALDATNLSYTIRRDTIGNRLIFRATTYLRGREPWVSDGTVAGTRVLTEFASLIRANSPFPARKYAGRRRLAGCASRLHDLWNCEPPRDCRRPQLLRGWGYGSEEEDIEQIFS